MKSKLSRLIVAVAVMLSDAHSALAADAFPVRPMRIIVNTAPGGLTDVTTRLISQYMGEYLKQSMVVDNRAGGDGLIGIRAVKSATADGYTLLASAGTIAQQMAMRQDAGYDLMKDFTGIGIMGRSPYLMVVAFYCCLQQGRPARNKPVDGAEQHAVRVLIESEDGFRVGTRCPHQFQTVLFRLEARLLVREHNARRIGLHF